MESPPQPSLFDRWPTMAVDCEEPRQTIHYWKRTRRIPAKKQPHVIRVATDLQLGFTVEDITWPFPEDRGAA